MEIIASPALAPHDVSKQAPMALCLLNGRARGDNHKVKRNVDIPVLPLVFGSQEIHPLVHPLVLGLDA